MPTILHDDNQSAIKIAEGNGVNNRTKHIDIKYHFVRDTVRDKVISINYCPTEEMIADSLTKPLTHKIFEKFRDQVLESPEELKN